jgi:hypothetical protein
LAGVRALGNQAWGGAKNLGTQAVNGVKNWGAQAMSGARNWGSKALDRFRKPNTQPSEKGFIRDVSDTEAANVWGAGPGGKPDLGLANRGYRPKPGERSMTKEQWKAQSGVSRAKHDSLLRGALGRQGLKKGDPYPHGLKEKWTVTEHGHTYEVRVHPADPNHGKAGDIYRVARRQNGVDANGQGYGWEYADSQGNWHHTKVLKPGKGGSVNPDFDSQAAADTHIPMPTGNIK